MVAAGIIFLIIGVVLVVVHVLARRKEGRLVAARPFTSGELATVASTVAGEIGDGGFKQLAELVGEADCARPLQSPLGQVPCLYYSMRISRRYEEEYWERDQNGNQVRRTRSGTEIMSSESQGVDFDLVDHAGALRVRLQGADFDGLRKTVDRFEPGGDGGGMRLQFGGFSMAIGTLGSGRRTLGYEYDESVLPVQGRLTVVGEVTDAHGGLSVGKGGEIFLVSTRSKAEMLGSARKTAKLTAAFSGICAAAGVVLLVLGLLK
ncbi:MAG: GIDE domain-containing protein [bacterium]